MNRLMITNRDRVTRLTPKTICRIPDPFAAGEWTVTRATPFAKTLVDYVLSTILLIACLPILAVCAVLIRITSRGPAIYRQARVGLGGKVFTIYKLRTMRQDAEKGTGPRWATPKDPRVTRLGNILRKLHLDELPQLVNVLRGEMSLIGPRPERPEIVATLRKLIPGYDQRHAVKPGLTGLAQIHLPPDSSVESVRLKLVLDRTYLQRFSMKLDLQILVCTGFKVLGLKSLYRRMPSRPSLARS